MSVEKIEIWKITFMVRRELRNQLVPIKPMYISDLIAQDIFNELDELSKTEISIIPIHKAQVIEKGIKEYDSSVLKKAVNDVMEEANKLKERLAKTWEEIKPTYKAQIIEKGIKEYNDAVLEEAINDLMKKIKRMEESIKDKSSMTLRPS